MKKVLITESQFRVIAEGYKRYHINMNVPLKDGGRTAARITPKEFEGKMKDIYEEYCKKEGKDSRGFNVGNFVYEFCHYWNDSKPPCLEKMNDDLSKIKHDGENCELIGNVESSNGLTYLKGEFGGDWEIPILFFIYWDGKKFRGYIPTKGNTFNRNTKIALGNSQDDDDYVRKECGDEKATANMVVFSVKDCLEDFKARVKIK